MACTRPDRSFVVAAFALVLAGAGATAQTIVISNAAQGLPQPLLEYSLSGEPRSALGHMEGPWAPTFDFITENTAYYVIRSPDAASATAFDGLYRFDADTGFSSPVMTFGAGVDGFGGGSIAYHNGTLYWLARQEDSRMSTLFAFDGVDTDAPNLRRIGETGVRDLAGLAVHPETGQLFTLRDVRDQFDDFIVWAEVHTLSTLSGASTFVVDAPALSGLSLGGGMDYSPDGEYILLARNFDLGGPDSYVILDGFNPFGGDIVMNFDDITRAGGILAGDVSFLVPSPGSALALAGGVFVLLRGARRRSP